MNRTIWRTIPFTDGLMQLSQNGDIRKVSTRNWLFNENVMRGEIYEKVNPALIFASKKDKQIYPMLKFIQSNKLVLKPVSVLMYETFYGIMGLAYQNILPSNGNFLDLNLNNLVLCQKDNFVYYNHCTTQDFTNNQLIREQPPELIRIKLSKTISCYSLNGTLLRYYNSKVDMLKDMRLSLTSFRKLMNGVGTSRIGEEYFWYGKGPRDLDLSLMHHGESTFIDSINEFNYLMVRCYSERGRVESIYNNILEASRYARVNFNQFYSEMKKKGYFLSNSKIWIVDKPMRRII